MLQQRLTRNLYTGQTEPLTAPFAFDLTEDLGNKRNLPSISQNLYLQPDGISYYFQPDGTSLYKRP
jgi:hypothetical protein